MIASKASSNIRYKSELNQNYIYSKVETTKKNKKNWIINQDFADPNYNLSFMNRPDEWKRMDIGVAVEEKSQTCYSIPQ